MESGQQGAENKGLTAYQNKGYQQIVLFMPIKKRQQDCRPLWV
jgi:hypothetical protein